MSFMAGMFGEFLSTNINRYGNNYPIIDISLEEDVNKYRYNNPLHVINKCVSQNSNYGWGNTLSDNEKLLAYYGDKNILIPCHWFNKNVKSLGFPNQIAVRIKANDIAWMNFAFILVWIKNHLRNTGLNYAKAGVLQNLEEDFEFRDEIFRLCRENHAMTWWLHAYSKKWLKNGTLDFKSYFIRYYMCNKAYHYRDPINFPDYNFINIDKVFYNTDNELIKFNQIFETNVPQQILLDYHQKNLDLVYTTLGLRLEDLTGDSWYNILYDYCYEIISTENI